jgi:hypothetical protein
MPQLSKKPDSPEKKGSRFSRGPLGSFPWWYLLLVLFILWIWQHFLSLSPTRTIPYSQFKQYLAAGQVVDCEIRDTEIIGHIAPTDMQFR